MYVGVQGIGTSKIELEFLRRHGVTHMDSNADAGNLDELVRLVGLVLARFLGGLVVHVGLPIALSLCRIWFQHRESAEIPRLDQENNSLYCKGTKC